jgi:hypothetical protein
MRGPIPFIYRVEDNGGVDDAGKYGADQDEPEQRTDKTRYACRSGKEKT